MSRHGYPPLEPTRKAAARAERRRLEEEAAERSASWARPPVKIGDVLEALAGDQSSMEVERGGIVERDQSEGAGGESPRS